MREKSAGYATGDEHLEYIKNSKYSAPKLIASKLINKL